MGTSAYPDSSAALGCICSGVCARLTSSQSVRMHKSSISSVYLVEQSHLRYALLALDWHLISHSFSNLVFACSLTDLHDDVFTYSLLDVLTAASNEALECIR